MASIDNVSRPLGGDFLCQVLDQPRIKIRILGQTGGPEIEPRCTLFATGNNLTLLGDVVRRAVIARMDAACAEPWQRQFHVDPLAQVLADRGKYIAAVLVAVRAFLLSGDQSSRRSPRLRRGRTWCAARSSPSAMATRCHHGDRRRRRSRPAGPRRGADRMVGRDRRPTTSTADLIQRASERDSVTGAYTAKDLRDALMTVAAGKGGDISAYSARRLAALAPRPRAGRLVLRRNWDAHANAARWLVAKR